MLETAASDPLIGRTLAERYQIETMLGEGGMGRVYQARHLRMSRRFAIKVLHGELSMQDNMVQRFAREAEATSRLSHRNVVGVVDFGETDAGLLYLVMEHVKGVTLRRLIRDEGPMATERVLALVGQLCDGLAHAHRHGLVHRDFKPDNVLVEHADDGDEVVRIVDFGIALASDRSRDSTGERLTGDGLVLGTPHYMAPEQSLGDPVDHRTDLYALGVVLYEMLAGAMPFEGPPSLVAQLHVHAEPPAIRDRVPGLSVDPLLEALARQLMAKRPEDRSPSARDVGVLIKLLRADRVAAQAALERGNGVEQRAERTPRAGTPGAELRASTAGWPGAIAAGTSRLRWSLLAVIAALLVVAVGGSSVHPRDVFQLPVAQPRVAQPPVAMVRESAPPSPIPKASQASQAPQASHGPPIPASSTASPETRPPAAAPVPPAPVEPAATASSAPEPDVRPRRSKSSAAKPARRTEEPPSLRSVRTGYAALGKRLDRLVDERGAAATARLKERYLAIPIAEVLREPSRVDGVARDIAALRREVDRVLRRARHSR